MDLEFPCSQREENLFGTKMQFSITRDGLSNFFRSGNRAKGVANVDRVFLWGVPFEGTLKDSLQ
jgi:hypothetical protein